MLFLELEDYALASGGQHVLVGVQLLSSVPGGAHKSAVYGPGACFGTCHVLFAIDGYMPMRPRTRTASSAGTILSCAPVGRGASQEHFGAARRHTASCLSSSARISGEDFGRHERKFGAAPRRSFREPAGIA